MSGYITYYGLLNENNTLYDYRFKQSQRLIWSNCRSHSATLVSSVPGRMITTNLRELLFVVSS